MRITKRQLKRIIKEEINTPSVEDEEVGMAINELQAIAATAIELSELIGEMDYVPEWGDGKISSTLDRLASLRSYMIGKAMGQS